MVYVDADADAVMTAAASAGISAWQAGELAPRGDGEAVILNGIESWG